MNVTNKTGQRLRKERRTDLIHVCYGILVGVGTDLSVEAGREEVEARPDKGWNGRGGMYRLG